MTQIQFKTKGSRKVIPKVYKTKKIRLKTTLHRLGYPQPPYTADQLEVFLKNITVKYIVTLESKVTNDWHLFAEYSNTIDTLRNQIKVKDKSIADIQECNEIIIDKYEAEIKVIINNANALRQQLKKVMN
tara:strand:+ start:382 stop:771 length:390 start_codon:yes stop_codon:yes gene_type:complete